MTNERITNLINKKNIINKQIDEVYKEIERNKNKISELYKEIEKIDIEIYRDEEGYL